MTEALDNACTKIAQKLATISELKSVPINPPEVASYSVFAIVHPLAGTYKISPAGTRMGLHTIAIDVLTTRMDLARSIATAKPLLDLIANKISLEFSYDASGNVGQRFSNSFQTLEEITYNEIRDNYGGVEVIGYRMLMNNVKILTNL